MSSKKKKHFTAPLKNYYFLLTVLDISSISTEYPKTSPTSLTLPFTVILFPFGYLIFKSFLMMSDNQF